MRDPTALKLEIDVMQLTELLEAVEITNKYQLPAMVVHPDLVTEANIARGLRQGHFQIIVPVDWPKGDKFGMAKLQGMRVEALEQDGFEIIVSNKENASDIKNELKAIEEFVRNHLPPHLEIRVVVEAFTREQDQLIKTIDAINEVPSPAYIRVDHHLRIQQAKANAKKHAALLELIREHTGVPLKLSGNLNTLKIVHACPAAKYAVGLKEAKAIIKEIRTVATQPIA